MLLSYPSFAEGVIFIAIGLFILIGAIRFQPLVSQPKVRRLNRKFFISAAVMIMLAGVYLLLLPWLLGMMGADYWILFAMGLFACFMLLIRLLML